MTDLIHQIIINKPQSETTRQALRLKDNVLTYGELRDQVIAVADCFRGYGLEMFDRVGIYLPKTIECTVSIFATSLASGVFVPINPVLKAHQVEHIANDCSIKILITNYARFKSIITLLPNLPNLKTVILTDKPANNELLTSIGMKVVFWEEMLTEKAKPTLLTYTQSSVTSTDMTAIFYTSGSTGKPKGVVLSHLNIICGAKSVAQYLQNTNKDKILAVLPLSFDYGFSQLTTGFLVGAEVILMDYLVANDVLNAIDKYQVTALAGVPPLWSKLAKLDWHKKGHSVRYFTNSGGALNPALLQQLLDHMPKAKPFLMYGLTEAFRSTYLHPEKVKLKPTSMGQAIPNANIMVTRDDGSECDVGEEGELVHSGPLVAMGYWNDPKKTQQRFKVSPKQIGELVIPQYSVYSGDRVIKDKDGDLYFVGRNDEMIKSSGYRISPMEIEECVYQLEEVLDTVALGVPHAELGQGIVIIVSLKQTLSVEITTHFTEQLIKHCRQQLANFMQPNAVIVLPSLPFNSNSKLDRAKLANQYQDHFQEK